MKFLGFEFAPLCVPFIRRRQTAAAAAGWILLVLVGTPLAWGGFFWSIIYSPVLRVVSLIYAGWMYFDRFTIETSPRRWEWLRNWSWWQDLADYFPVKLVKTAELPTDQSYLFAVFPHGVLSVGCYCAFATNSRRFCDVFPGLTPGLVTLNLHFITPYIRELSHAMGSVPSKASSIIKRLSTPGQAIALVPGGAEEAFYNKPGECNIILNRRKGFIRVALQSGSSLVPTVAFGESDVFDQLHWPSGSFMRWTQDVCKKWTGVAPIHLVGRGIFQYTYGLVPFRKPITLVVGSPISTIKTDHPSEEDIDALHKIFCERLQKLFDTHKKTYYANENIKLTFL